jgi:hypothetical protein
MDVLLLGRVILFRGKYIQNGVYPEKFLGYDRLQPLHILYSEA